MLRENETILLPIICRHLEPWEKKARYGVGLMKFTIWNNKLNSQKMKMRHERDIVIYTLR